MQSLPLGRVFTLLEPGPVVLVTTSNDGRDNVMTISWTMVLDFAARFAITTGPWNHSFAALRETGECVLAIPTVDLIDTVVGVGTCSGVDTDKFARFGLTRVPAAQVRAPLLAECLANIECRVVDLVTQHAIVVLEGVAAWLGHSNDRTQQGYGHARSSRGAVVITAAKASRPVRLTKTLPPTLAQRFAKVATRLAARTSSQSAQKASPLRRHLPRPGW